MTATTQAAGPQAVWFIHWLRAGAVGVVVLAHLLIAFWAVNPAFASLYHVEPMGAELRRPFWEPLARDMGPTYVYGMAAVGLFFLISGFLIPLTMEGRTVGRFVRARIFRIFPVWITATVLVAGLFLLAAETAGIPVGAPWQSWLATATTTSDITGHPLLNPVGWTLLVEVKFYVLCAIGAATVGLHRATAVAGAAIVWTVAAVAIWGNIDGFAIDHHRTWVAVNALAWDAQHMCMALVGVCFYNFARNGWSMPKFLLSAGTCFACVATAASQIIDGNGYVLQKFVGYAIGVGLFGLAYANRHRFPPSRLAAYAADISYTVFAVHLALGIVIISALVRHGVIAEFATIIALLVIAVVSVAIHHAIERPANSYGKRLRLGRRPAQAAEQPD